MIYTYQHNGQTYTVTLEPQSDGTFRAVIGDNSYQVEAVPLPNGGWRLQNNTVYVAAQSDQRFISLNGQAFSFTVPDSRSRRRRAAGSGGDLTAQMPGQVANVLVNEGDAVEKGQTLVILEAMKMEIRVAAPTEGRVKRLLVEKGQVVERGQVLLEIEGTAAQR